MKNKAPLVWPTGHFTIDDMQKSYPDMVNITLRFRIKKAASMKEIVDIGRIKPAIGRPKLVYAKSPVSEDVVKAAYASGVLPPVDTTEKVSVVNIKKTEKPVVPTVPTTTSNVSTPNVTA